MILDFDSYNNSWLCGLVKSNFTNLNLVDSYFNDISQKHVPSNSVIYLDDEVQDSWSWITPTTLDKNVIIICKIKSVYDNLRKSGFKCLYYPYWHIVDDALAIRKLGGKVKPMPLMPQLRKNYSFFCLNRNQTDTRTWLVEQIIKLNLIDYGYVTYIKSTQKYEGVHSKPIIYHYKDNDYGFERHHHWYNDIGYSSNVANYYFIQENIKAPINIAHETMLCPFFPTEKSFLAFFTKKVPIILAETKRIADLESEGFDVFRDYINHEYDLTEDPYAKITQALVDNREILINFNVDVSKRTNSNFEFLINDWLDKKLIELTNGINSLV